MCAPQFTCLPLQCLHYCSVAALVCHFSVCEQNINMFCCRLDDPVSTVTARRYASAAYAVVVCPSVTSRYCIETTGLTQLVLAMEA